MVAQHFATFRKIHIKALCWTENLYVHACVFMWDTGSPLIPKSDLVPAFWCIIPPLASRKGLWWGSRRGDPYCLHLLCQYWNCFGDFPLVSSSSLPVMQAVFHLSLLSSSVACECWDHQAGRPPPLTAGGSALSPRSVLMTPSHHSHWQRKDKNICVQQC